MVPADLITAHLPAFALVLARMTGLFLFAPLLSSPSVPTRFKVLIAVSLTMVLYPTVGVAHLTNARLDLFTLGPLLASEVLIGLSIGVLAAIPLMVAQLAGVIAGQQMGLGLAAVYNPTLDFESDSLGQILFFAALASYLSVGGFEAVYGTLLETYRVLPLGGFAMDRAPLDVLVQVVHLGMEAAVRMSLPVMLILTVETAAAGLIMKSVPSLNIMNVGFPIRILLGLLMIISSLALMLEVKMEHVSESYELLRAWASGLGSART
jgi:flagellar biosynthetic protein FliR